MSLNSLLKSRNVSQADICRATGISPSQLSLHITGTYKLSTRHLEQIASFLSVPVSTISGDSKISSRQGGRNV